MTVVSSRGRRRGGDFTRGSCRNRSIRRGGLHALRTASDNRAAARSDRLDGAVFARARSRFRVSPQPSAVSAFMNNPRTTARAHRRAPARVDRKTRLAARGPARSRRETRRQNRRRVKLVNERKSDRSPITPGEITYLSATCK